MANPRKCGVSITYNGKNVTTSLSDYINSFSYTDVASGESDTITLAIHDIGQQWIDKWFPSKGDKIEASITIENWETEGDKSTFKCGSFTLDEFQFSGPAVKGELNAISVPMEESFKATKRTKTWTSVTVQEMAREIAQRASVELSYEANVIKIESIEQTDKTDSEFLYEICKTFGLAMKAYSGKIVIYDEEVYEKKDSVTTLKKEDLLSWDYKTTLDGTYTGARIQYTDPNTEEDITATVGDGKRILEMNEKADNIDDAELKAVAAVNQENKSMTTMTVDIVPNTKIIASSNVTISGLAKLNGKYAVDKVEHTVGGSSKYGMKLELRLIQERLKANARPEPDTSSVSGISYQIVRGDNLWNLSKKYLGSGSRYMEIYNANAEIIEATARKYGKPSSSNGHWIYPGTIITIPQ